jgi:hypothetical protein
MLEFHSHNNNLLPMVVLVSVMLLNVGISTSLILGAAWSLASYQIFILAVIEGLAIYFSYSQSKCREPTDTF